MFGIRVEMNNRPLDLKIERVSFKTFHEKSYFNCFCDFFFKI